MKKNVYLFFTIIVVAIMTSCGGKKNQDNLVEDQVADEVVDAVPDAVVDAVVDAVPDDTNEASESNYSPTFTIVAVYEELDNGIHTGTRRTYTIEVNKNGMYTSTRKDERKDHRTGYKWMDDGVVENNGRWTIAYRTVGDQSQKVYDLREQNGSTFAYIPNDLENIWVNGNWTDCANFNLKTALKVAEIRTSKGTNVIIPEEERTSEPKEIDIIGRIYGVLYSEKIDSVLYNFATFLKFQEDYFTLVRYNYRGGKDGFEEKGKTQKYRVYYRRHGNSIETRNPPRNIDYSGGIDNKIDYIGHVWDIKYLDVEENGHVISNRHTFPILILPEDENKYYKKPFFHVLNVNDFELD